MLIEIWDEWMRAEDVKRIIVFDAIEAQPAVVRRGFFRTAVVSAPVLAEPPEVRVYRVSGGYLNEYFDTIEEARGAANAIAASVNDALRRQMPQPAGEANA